jgi:hypothetical protein
MRNRRTHKCVIALEDAPHVRAEIAANAAIKASFSAYLGFIKHENLLPPQTVGF